MRLLLDTHVLLWWLGNDPSLIVDASKRRPVGSVTVAAENLVLRGSAKFNTTIAGAVASV